MKEEQFIVRRPRHEVLERADFRITVDWIASTRPVDAELADVSRYGLKLIIGSRIPENARVRICLDQPANQFHLILPVTVRWARQENDGRWGMGCIFDRELTWELMGELFLNGILSSRSLA